MLISSATENIHTVRTKETDKGKGVMTMLRAFFAMLCVYALIILGAQVAQLVETFRRRVKPVRRVEIDEEDFPALNEG